MSGDDLAREGWQPLAEKLLITYNYKQGGRDYMIMKMRDVLKRKNGQKGFTLVELIVVMAILAVLAAIAVPRYTGTLDKAKLQADQASAKTIVSAVAIAEAQGSMTPAPAVAGKPTVAELVSANLLASAPKSAQDPTKGFVITYAGSYDVSKVSIDGGADVYTK